VKRTVRAQIERGLKRGQVAQVVERSPEKAGVGGSTPSLATTFQSTYSESLDSNQPTICPQNEGLRYTTKLVVGFFSVHEPFSSSVRNIPCASSLADVMAWA
jgi:hypothetical protein